MTKRGMARSIRATASKRKRMAGDDSLALACLLALAMACSVSGPADAHIVAGEGEGFLSGFKHPISGLDHILAMVSVGLWGAQLGAPAIWLLPVTFPIVMAFGGFLGLIGVPFPGVEVGIAMSALLLGAAVMTQWRPPLFAAAALVGVFALFHGHAHGAELPPGESGLLYSVGFVIATGLLHLIGIAVGDGARVGLGTSYPARSRRGRRHGRRLFPLAGGRRVKIKSHWTPCTAAGLAGLALALSSSSAEAHMVTTGLGPVYDGVAHFALTPEDSMTVVGLAVLGGLRGPAHGRRALFALAGFWFVGGAVALLVARPAGTFIPALSLLVVGGLVATDVALSSWAIAAVAAVLAAAHGYVDASSLPADSSGLLMVLGMSVAAFVACAIVAALLVPLRSPLAHIAMRVSGSWIAASGLLLLGWTLRGEIGIAAE